MLYISDTNGARIHEYNTTLGTLATFAGSGTAGYLDGIGAAAQVHRPRGMTSDGTSLYWVEFNQHTIRQGVFATKSVTTAVGTPACPTQANCNGSFVDDVYGAAAGLSTPFSVVYHYPSESLFFVDAGNSVIRRVQ